MFTGLQLAFLFTFSLAIASFCKKWIRFLVSFLLGLYSTLQIVSVFLGGSLMDYKFYEHLDLKEAWSLKDFYASQFIIFFILFLIITTLIYIGGIFLKKFLPKRRTPIVLLIVTCIGMIIPRGIISSSYEILSLKLADSKSFKKALSDVNVDTALYKEPSAIKAKPGKNIIVLSLESLEKGYLQPPLTDLTPNLQRLKDDYNYYDLNQNVGNGWTSASMYGTLTGLPAFFKSSGNDTFQNAYDSKVTSLTAVLKKAGYDLTYLMGNKEFSGVNDMLTLFGFTVKSEKDFETKYPKTSWGIHDQDLFNEAKKEVIKKKTSGKPFALFLSTISGHFPDGVKDERLDGLFPERESNLEYMTYATDHLVGNFMEFLSTEGLLENTDVFIFPDHLLMGNSSPVINKFSERGLYLITTASSAHLNIDTSTSLYQIDLPRIILDGAQVQTNATFLTDYIKDIDKDSFIKEHKAAFVSLNEASLLTGDFKGGITLSRKQNKTLQLSAKNSGYTTNIGPLKEHTLYVALFDKEMRFIKYTQMSKNNAFKDTEEARLIFSISEGKLFSYLKRGAFLGIPKRSTDQVTFTADELSIFEDWALLLPEIEPDPKTLLLKSSGYNAFKTHGIGQVYIGLTPYKLQRGLNLVTFSNGIQNVNNYDTFTSEEDTKSLISKLEQLITSKETFALIAHDSAEKALLKESEAFKALGFKTLLNLKTREAYIGHYNNGVLQEFKDPQSITKEFPLPNPPQIDKSALAKDPTRFIAHAGGEIDGIKYTNSLEALNNSYNNGLRYFELDIITSSDDKFVAAHDWNIWKQHSGYTGETPVTASVFLQHKLKNKYTPLTMPEINQWFKNHPDAILVTDKVNTPALFATQFIDKSRLMMELFSLQAVKEAQGLGLMSAMPSENVVQGLGTNPVQKLKELDVKHIAMSRKNIAKKINLINALKQAGIKTYVYHVNFEAGKNEQYVLDYELDYVYGMYADKWMIKE